MTTITAPRRLLRPPFPSPSPRAFLVAFVATLLAGLIVIAGLSVGVGMATGDRALPGVTVGGVSLAGLERAAAEARLQEALPSLGSGDATIAAGDAEVVVGYGEIGRRYEMAAMLDAAFGVGRDGNPIGDGIARLRSLVHPTALPVVVHAYDPERLEAAVATVTAEMRVAAVDARVERSGTSFEVLPSAEGRELDPERVRAALAAAAATTDAADVRLALAPTVVPPQVTTAQATLAARMAEAAAVDLELTVPGAAPEEATIELSGETIASWITFGADEAVPYAMQIDASAAGEAITALVEQVDRDPVNARFAVAGSGLGGIVPGQSGRQLDVERSTESLLGALAGRSGAPLASLALAVDVTEPSLTTAEAEQILPQMQMVSSWTTHYVPGDGNGFGANISIPAHDLDGYHVMPGEWFSFWGGIGPVTVERGYTYGGAIINGRSTQGVALAGGICSTSTTLFNAAMRAGLEIGERTAHYYYIDRYPTGLDATVSIFDDWVTDLTFRNDTEHPIVIRGFGTPGKVTFQIWSVPNGRTVALSDPIITNRRAATETTQVDPSLAPGTSRRVEYPHDGFQSTVTRTVRGPDGSILHQNTWFSDYRTVNGITLVGPNTAAEPPPSDDDEGDTAGDGGVGDLPDDPPDGGEED